MSDYKTRQARTAEQDTSLHQALRELGQAADPGPEWTVVLSLLRGGWPGSLTEAEALAWPALLSDINPVKVANAVRELHKSGSRWRPRPSEVRALLAPDLDPDSKAAPPPVFDTAWSYILRAGVQSGYTEPDGYRWMDAHSHPAVAAWSKVRGLRTLWRLPIDSQEYGSIVRRDLRNEYTGFARDWTDPAQRTSILRLADSRSRNTQTALTGGLRKPALAPPPAPGAPGAPEAP